MLANGKKTTMVPLQEKGISQLQLSVPERALFLWIKMNQVVHALEKPCRFIQCSLREVIRTRDAYKAIHKHIDFEGRRYNVEIDASPIKNKGGNIAHCNI